MPSYVIGLDLGAETVKAAVLKGSFRGYEVEDFLSLEPADFAATGEFIPAQGPSPRGEHDDGDGEGDEGDDGAPQVAIMSAAASESPELKAARAVIEAVGHQQAIVIASVPAERVSAWRVEMPFTDRKRIDQTIGFEVENYVPWDLEDVVLDYQVLDSGSGGAQVFAAMVPTERIAELLESLRRIAVDPRHVAVDAAELARLLPISDECEVILDIGATRTLVCVVRDGKAWWIRSLDLGAASFGEDGDLGPFLGSVRATLLAAEESGAPPIDAVVLCGGGSKREGLREALAEELGVEVDALELPSSQVNTDMAPRPEPEHALCYALALKGFAERDRVGVTFRKGPFAWKADSRLYTRLALAAVAAVMVLCVGFVVMHFVNVAKLNSQLEASNDRLRDTVLAEFPTVSPTQLMTPDGAIGVMQDQVFALQARADALRGPSSTPLSSLKDLSDTIPANLKVDLDEYLANEEMIRVRGTTDSFENADKIEQALKGSPQFQGAKKSDVNKARDGRTSFVVTIPRLEEEVEG